MARYRKRPVEVEAVRVADALEAAAHDWKALPDWLAAAYAEGKVVFLPDGVAITTLEGEMSGGLDDWIIQGVEGEIYPCKPSIFDATYEEVPDA